MVINYSSAGFIKELIDRIESSDEKTAREIIKTFEENVRKNMSKG